MPLTISSWYTSFPPITTSSALIPSFAGWYNFVGWYNNHHNKQSQVKKVEEGEVLQVLKNRYMADQIYVST